MRTPHAARAAGDVEAGYVGEGPLWATLGHSGRLFLLEHGLDVCRGTLELEVMQLDVSRRRLGVRARHAHLVGHVGVLLGGVVLDVARTQSRPNIVDLMPGANDDE